MSKLTKSSAISLLASIRYPGIDLYGSFSRDGSTVSITMRDCVSNTWERAERSYTINDYTDSNWEYGLRAHIEANLADMTAELSTKVEAKLAAQELANNEKKAKITALAAEYLAGKKIPINNYGDLSPIINEEEKEAILSISVVVSNSYRVSDLQKTGYRAFSLVSSWVNGKPEKKIYVIGEVDLNKLAKKMQANLEGIQNLAAAKQAELWLTAGGQAGVRYEEVSIDDVVGEFVSDVNDDELFARSGWQKEARVLDNRRPGESAWRQEKRIRNKWESSDDYQAARAAAESAAKYYRALEIAPSMGYIVAPKVYIFNSEIKETSKKIWKNMES